MKTAKQMIALLLALVLVLGLMPGQALYAYAAAGDGVVEEEGDISVPLPTQGSSNNNPTDAPDPEPEPDVPSNEPATLSFADLANRVSVSTEQQVWQQNGITVTNDKAKSTTDVNEQYFAPARFYKSSKVTIDYPGMRMLVIDCSEAKYATALKDSAYETAGVTVTVEGQIATIVFDIARDSFVVEELAAQTRFAKLTVYTTSEPVPEPEAIGTGILLTEKPVSGDLVVIYSSGNAMTATPSGVRLEGVAAAVAGSKLPITEDMAQLEVAVDGEYYIFTVDGKYLTSAATGNGLSLQSELTDCGKWTLESVSSGVWHIMNVGANYNGNYNQAMEYYSGFTTFGVQDTAAYAMQLFKVSDETVDPDPDPTPDPEPGEVNYGPLAQDTAYYMQLVQVLMNKTLYLTGDMNGEYLATTENAAEEAATVYVEKVDGQGVRFYIADGTAKTYIEIFLNSEGKPRPALSETANVVWTYNEEAGTYTVELEGTEYYLGTYSTYTTISASNISYITGDNADNKGQSQFLALCIEPSEVPEPDPNPDPEPTETAVLLTEKPVNGDRIVIYNSGNAMTAIASGARLAGLAATVTDDQLTVTAAMAQLEVTVDGEYYIFTVDGKYLTSAATGNGLSLQSELTDCGKWTLESVSSGVWHIMNVGANYNGNYNQAMEYYSGFTTYGVQDTAAYAMQLFKVGAASEEPEPSENARISVSLSKPTATWGEEVEVTVSISDFEVITAIGYIPLLNGKAFEVISGEVVVEEEAAFKEFTVQDGGEVLFDEPVAVSGEVFRFTIRIKDTAAAGEYPITDVAAVRNDLTEYQFGLKDATLTVLCGHNGRTFEHNDAQTHWVSCPECETKLLAEHNFVDGACADCGGDNTWIPGDFNSDGDVTDADALHLLRHTLFPDRYPIPASGDVNMDGDITDADALYLLRYTLFPDRYPLYPEAEA